jgi:predicted ArsR family transcriptional regulator
MAALATTELRGRMDHPHPPQSGSAVRASPSAHPGPERLAQIPGERHDAFAALASHARYQILDALATRPKTIKELTEELRLHRITLRYHIAFLLREGFVEEAPTLRRGQAGRPAARYQTARHAGIPGFPARHFEVIAQAALAALLDALGESDARRRLYLKGKNLGVGLVRGIAATKNVKKWTPAAFDEHILRGSYRDMGVSSEVLAANARSIEYRTYSCPFLELAEQMPDLVCDALDAGFHDGMDEALGGARTSRRMCLGHGDLYCEYAVTWASRRAPPSRGPGTAPAPEKEAAK